MEQQHKMVFSECEPFVLMSSDNYQESPPSNGQCFKLYKYIICTVVSYGVRFTV